MAEPEGERERGGGEQESGCLEGEREGGRDVDFQLTGSASAAL